MPSEPIGRLHEPPPARFVERRRRPRDRISDEPVINLLHRWSVEIVCGLYAAGLVYLALVPFDLRATGHPTAAEGAVWGLGVKEFNLPDVIANIAFYAPMGALLFRSLWRRRFPRIVAAFVALVLIAAESYGVEYAQRHLASRVASWADVTANVLGAVLGVVAALVLNGLLHILFNRAKDAVQRNGPSMALKAFACLVLVVQLRPYDVVADPIHTAYALRHADFSPGAVWRALPNRASKRSTWHGVTRSDTLARMRWEYAADRAADVAAYAAIAFLAILAHSERRGPKIHPYAEAAFACLALAAIVIGVRVFLVSHGLDMAHWHCAFAGWVLGCAIAAGLVRRSSADPAQGSLRSREAVVAMTLAVTAGLLALYELVPFDFSAANAGRLGNGRLILFPFKAHFQSRPNMAFQDLSGDLLRFAALGVVLNVMLERRVKWRWRVQASAIVGACCAAAALFEVVHLFMPSRYSDVTTLLLAALGAATGVVALRWARDFHAWLLPRHADDPLTRALIEGPSYDKGALTALGSRRAGASPTDRAESNQPA